jgi:hypothetical protein
MAGPSIVAAGTLAAGGALKAFSQVREGKIAKQTSDLNAELQERESQQIEAQGRVRERQLRRQAGQVFGRQRVVGAAAGFADTGQLLEIADLSALELERDTLINRFDTKQRADAVRFGAQTTKFAGKQARDASRLGAGATILGSAGGLLSGGFGG